METGSPRRKLSDDVTVVHQTRPAPRRDTTLSWRVGTTVVVGIVSTVAALVGFVLSYSAREQGDTDSRVAEFEASLRDYVRAATQAGYARIEGVDFERYELEIPIQAALGKYTVRLERAARGLSYRNTDLAKARINQTVAEYNFAQSSDEQDLRVHSDKSLRALQEDWRIENTSKAILMALLVATLSGVAAGIVTWIATVGVALIWWFMMDRLRDIARAIKED